MFLRRQRISDLPPSRGSSHCACSIQHCKLRPKETSDLIQIQTEWAGETRLRARRALSRVCPDAFRCSCTPSILTAASTENTANTTQSTESHTRIAKSETPLLLVLKAATCFGSVVTMIHIILRMKTWMPAITQYKSNCPRTPS